MGGDGVKGLFLKVAYYGIPILSMAVIVGILFSGNFLKKPMTGDDDVVESLDSVVELALTDRWEEASEKAEGMQRAWEKVRGRVYLTSASDDMEIFDMSISELLGAIEGRDEVQVRITHRRLLSLWEDLGS